jgi:hypothetical protein
VEERGREAGEFNGTGRPTKEKGRTQEKRERGAKQDTVYSVLNFDFTLTRGHCLFSVSKPNPI